MSSSSERTVRTVLGDVKPEQLGHTQCHEHIYLEKGPSFACNPALCMDDYEKSRKELCDYALAGGGTIVDAQPGGCGRNAAVLARLSEASGVRIVAVTGFHKKCFFDRDSGLDIQSETALTERFCTEVKTGMSKTFVCQHRPQGTTTQQMHMNMINFLTTVAITVHGG